MFGQDPVFSQFYNARLQMNAAFAGISSSPNIQLNYRNQWPLIPTVYTNYQVSYDQKVATRSGAGISVLSDNAGSGTIQNTGVSGFYSYNLRIKDDYYIRGGMSAGMNFLSLNADKFIFGDGIDPTDGPYTAGGTPLPTQESVVSVREKYFQLGCGVLLYTPKMYLGISLHNLNTPRIFNNIDNSAGQVGSVVPLRWNLHWGYQIMLEKSNKNKLSSFIFPNLHVIDQGGFKQINVGSILSLRAFHTGVWFRHTVNNSDAVILSAGVQKDFLKFTYSFDYTVSTLSIAQGGSHEIGIALNFDYLHPKRTNYNDCFEIFR